MRPNVSIEAYAELVQEAMLDAKKMQDFLWDRLSGIHKPYDQVVWVEMFQKRVDKISKLDTRLDVTR